MLIVFFIKQLFTVVIGCQIKKNISYEIYSSIINTMDRETISMVLKQSKKRLEDGNENFLRAIDEQMKKETEFRATIRCLENSTYSMVDIMTLREKLDLSPKDANMKKELEFVADVQTKLRKEINLSRKRTQKLEKNSREFKRMLVDDVGQSEVFEIPDSPPHNADNENTDDDIQSKVKIFFHLSFSGCSIEF